MKCILYFSGHLSGIVEYGMHWQLGVQKKSERWSERLKRFRRLSKAVKTANENSKVILFLFSSFNSYYRLQASFHVSHSELSSEAGELKSTVADLTRICGDMRDRCRTAPTIPHDFG